MRQRETLRRARLSNDREFPNTIRALLQNFALFKKWNRPYPSAMFAVVERAARNS